MTLAGGECFGSGMFPNEDGTCPECGRAGVGCHSVSKRLARHKPTVTDWQRQHAPPVGDVDEFARLAARLNVGAWIGEERRLYADVKFGEGTPTRQALIIDMIEHGLSVGSQWDVFIANQISRVRLFGLDNEAGRQALGKLVVQLLHALETAVQHLGPLPEPGQPSGEVREWKRAD